MACTIDKVLAPNKKESILFKELLKRGEGGYNEAVKSWLMTKSPRFKEWFRDSEVVDANGEPIIMYHGSGSSFDSFSTDAFFKGEGGMAFGAGFYLTDNKQEAEAYRNQATVKRQTQWYKDNFEEVNRIATDAIKKLSEKDKALLNEWRDVRSEWFKAIDKSELEGNVNLPVIGKIFDALATVATKILKVVYGVDAKHARMQKIENMKLSNGFTVAFMLSPISSVREANQKKIESESVVFSTYLSVQKSLEWEKQADHMLIRKILEDFPHANGVELTRNGGSLYFELARLLVQNPLPKHMGIHDNIYSVNTLPVSRYLQRLGYDAVKHKNPSGFTHYIMFEPSKIKSINNQGTFKTHSDNMLWDDRSTIQKGSVASKDYILEQADRIMGRKDNVSWKDAYEANPDAVGSYMDGMVSYIMGKATKETAHHEPIHYFLNRILTKDEYDFLHKHFAEEHDLDPFLDAIEVHERMTDAAVAFDMGRMTFSGKITRLFEKFWLAVRNWLFHRENTNSEDVQEIFDSIGRRYKDKGLDNLTAWLQVKANMPELEVREDAPPITEDELHSTSQLTPEELDAESEEVNASIEDEMERSALASNIVKKTKGRFTPDEFRKLINYGVKKYKWSKFNVRDNSIHINDKVSKPRPPSADIDTFDDMLSKSTGSVSQDRAKQFISIFREVNLRLKVADLLMVKAVKAPKLALNQPIKLDGVSKVELEMVNDFKNNHFSGQKSVEVSVFVEAYKKYVKSLYDIRDTDTTDGYGAKNDNGVFIPYGVGRVIDVSDVSPENSDGGNRVVLVKDGIYQGGHKFNPKKHDVSRSINGIGWYVEFDWKGSRFLNEYQTDMLDNFIKQLKNAMEHSDSNSGVYMDKKDYYVRSTINSIFSNMPGAQFPGIYQITNMDVDRNLLDDIDSIQELVLSEAKQHLNYSIQNQESIRENISQNRRTVGAIKELLLDVDLMRLKPYREYSHQELEDVYVKIENRWNELRERWDITSRTSSIDLGLVGNLGEGVRVIEMPNRRDNGNTTRPRYYSAKQAISRQLFKSKKHVDIQEKELKKTFGAINLAMKNIDLASTKAFITKIVTEITEAKEAASMYWEEVNSEVKSQGLGKVEKYEPTKNDLVYKNLYENFFKLTLSHSFVKARQDGYTKVLLPTYDVMKAVEGNNIASSLYSTPNDVKRGNAKNNSVGPFYSTLSKMKGVKTNIISNVEGAIEPDMEFIEVDLTNYEPGGVELFHTVKQPETKEVYGPQLKDADKLSSAVRSIKLFVNKQLNSLHHRKVDNKAMKQQRMNKLLNALDGLTTVESIDLFIKETLSNMNKTNKRFQRLIKGVDDDGNVINMTPQEKIQELVAINEYLNGYNILDEIDSHIGLDTEDGLQYEEDGGLTNISSLKLLAVAKIERDRMKKLYLREGIPIYADFLWEHMGPEVNDHVRDVMNRPDLVLTKEKLIQELRVASKDKDLASAMFNPLISSSDAVLALFAKAVKSKLYEARAKDVDFKYDMGAAFRKFKSSIGKSVNNVLKFNEGLYELIDVPMYTTEVDENGETKTVVTLVKRAAFTQAYDISKFEKAKAAMYKEIGPKPDGELDLRLWNMKVRDWYRENTQPVDDAQERIDEMNRRFSANEITRADYEDWFENNVVESIAGIYFKGELTRPQDKYLNPKWTAMYSYDSSTKRWKPRNAKGLYHEFLLSSYMKAQEKLPEKFRKGYILPSIRKDVRDRMSEKGAWNTVKESAIDSVKFRATDMQYNHQNIAADGSEVKYIPIYFTQNMDGNEVNLDLASSVMMFTSMANKYEALSSIQAEVQLGQDIVNSRKYIKSDSRGQQIVDSLAERIGIREFAKKQGNHNSTRHMNEFIDSIFYGESELKAEWAGIDWNKAANTLMTVTAIRTLAGNLLQGVNNVLVGNVQMEIEARAKQFLDKKNLSKGREIYRKKVKYLIADFGKLDQTSWVTQMVEKFDPMQGNFTDNFGKNISGTTAKKLFTTDSLFLLQHAGEHSLLISFMFALMDATPVKTTDGKIIKLHEAYVMKDGRLTLRDDAIWTKKQEQDFIDRMHGINKLMHGVYNSFDAGIANRQAGWRLVFMFRKFLIPSIRRRYSPGRADYEIDNGMEGYYNVFYRTVLKDLMALKFDALYNWSRYNEFERQGIRRTVTEIGYIVVLMTMISLLGAGDDKTEKNSWAYNFLLYQLIRLKSELNFYNPIGGILGGDAWKILKSPTATITTVEAVGKLFEQVLKDPLGQYKRDTGIWEKGDSKVISKGAKALGLGNTLSPDQAIKYFNQ